MSDVSKTASEAVEVLEPQTQEAAEEVVADVAAADAIAEAVIEESTFGADAADAVLETSAIAETVIEEALADAAIVEVDAVADVVETADGAIVEIDEVVAEAETADGAIVEVDEVVAEAETADGAIVEVDEVVAEAETADGAIVEVDEIVAEVETVDGTIVEIDEVVAEAETADGVIVEVDETVAEIETADGAMVDVEEDVVDVVAEVDTAAESSTAVAPSAPAESSTDVGGKRVVRTLAVGQEVTGTVKRISEFGAFVDIGVGRDGLVHISELSVKRVGKVTDVIKEGEQVQLWIKKLDRERNRISLTLIPPGTVTIRDLNKDDIVNGIVTRILPYGAFVDIGVGRDALLHVREMGERYIAKPEEVVKVGEQIEARIIEIQRRRGRIDLSIKGLRPEPEPETAPVVEEKSSESKSEPVAAAEPEVDPFADMEVLSPFQVALMRAQERSGVELDYDAQSGKKSKSRKDKQRREQEEIFERTLKTR